MKLLKQYRKLLLLFCLPLLLALPALTAEAGTLYESPYVKFSPDGYAWTTEESLPYTDNYRNYALGQYPEYWYEQGFILDTGIESTLRTLQEGEHYYSYDRMGEVPVGYWQVAWNQGRCIHNSDVDSWHSVPNNQEKCHNAYYSGWFAYCADCGERLSYALAYMSKEAAASITSIDVNLGYYYMCPTNGHLETNCDASTHSCKSISFNKYKVVYEKNGTFVNGEMQPSFHMYNNETVYRGEPITPITRLSKNTYTRMGYTFTGWNTKPDGAGESFEDGATIFNLSLYDINVDPEKATVTLYAQWEKTENTLRIDPDGGSYEGKTGIMELTQGYGTTYFADPEKVTAPEGYTVSFDTGGGAALAPIKAATVFSSWSMSQPFYGKFRENTYAFLGAMGDTDTLTATYDAVPVILPTPSRPGHSFGGWSEDPEGKKPVGFGGDEYTPKKDVTLYATWVELVLWSYDNYTANDRKGAVNLKWSQPDEQAKTYKLYRSTDGSNFSLLYGAKEATDKNATEQNFAYKGASEVYTVPYGGFYTLAAGGAQGGNYGSYTGGRGGSVTAKFYLTAGEKLTVTVGGQGGYNGGGAATKFGNGGGATIIKSNLKGILLAAGGGGGASPSGNGGAGGLSTSLRADKNGSGASGQAGGGAGYVGGSCGEQITHSHASSCLHVHTGNAVSGGGCYGTAIRCGGSINKSTTGETVGGYYDGCHQAGANGTCPQCGHVYDGTHCRETWYYPGRTTYACSKCGKDYGERVTEVCDAVVGYSLSCDIQYVCGYTQGQVLSSKPAYGGSSYVNESYSISSRFTPDDRGGNGMAAVTANAVGYMNTLTLDGVAAPDLAAPDAVSADSVRFKTLGAGTIQVSFDKPSDNGTQYWWKAESYQEGTEALLCTSNITTNTLTTGTAGYYYILDTTPTHGDRFVTASNAQNKGSILTTATLNCNMDYGVQYLHIAAVDVAGNVGATTDIKIDKAAQEWPVATDKVQITDTIGGKAYGTVYPAGAGAYYVRADGEGPFRLSFNSYLDGEARSDYQIDYQIFAAALDSHGRTQEYITKLPFTSPVTADGALPVSSFVRQMNGVSILKDASNTGAARSNASKSNSFYQCFTMPSSYSGKTIVVTPIAGATGTEEVTYSSWEKDKLNSVTLIADGEAPIVSGTEQLEGMELIHRENQPIYLNLSVEDKLSGVKDFTVTIQNVDNYCNKTYTPEADGHIYIDLTEELPVFSGSFVVNIKAVDQVGNVREICYGATEFSLSAHISRILEPHEPLFKCGESGILHITTWGYADYVEVEFPEEMLALNPNLNKTYYYDLDSLYKQEEELQFMIPLYTPANAKYIITVRAYKGDKKLEEYPALSTISVEGSVADELRTRLR